MKPTIALTIGDAAGIGPEISLKVAALPEVRSLCRVVLVGDGAVCREHAAVAGVELPIHGISRSGLAAALAAPAPRDGLELLDVGALAEAVPFGKADPAAGRASYAYIVAAIEEAQAGHFAGVVTAPINKHALHIGGVDVPGHTEIFGDMTRSDPYAMMMYAERMAVGLVTCHQSLASVPQSLNADRIAAVGQLLHRSVLRIRGVAPRIAALGLNPHAGEEGLFGWEERDLVAPAVEQLRREGITISDPLPPDAAFTKRALQQYDAHLCLYHDQGLIPFKMLCFDEGVNVTMGLPFVRTSPDHGTAYDIAGRGIAETSSLLEALRLAVRLSMPVPAEGEPR